MNIRLCLVLLGLTLTVACAAPTQLHREPAPVLGSSQLPRALEYPAGLPSPLELLTRGVSAVPGDLARRGTQFDLAGGMNRLTGVGGLGEFTPETGVELNDHAWAVYRYNLSGYAGLPLVQLNWESAPQPANLHVAAGNFVTGRWDWLTPDGVTRANLGTLAPYRAGDGTALLVVLLSGGPPAELAVSAFSAPQLAETFEDRVAAADNDTKWLVNCYAPLPEWRDADRVFQLDSLRDFADEVLALTNAERATLMLPPLAHSVHLELLSQAHSRHMGLRDFFDHTDPYGFNPFERFDLMRPPVHLFAGENIAWGQLTAAAVMADWIASPGHHANIVHPSFTHLGVGVYWHRGAIYWTQFFAAFPSDPATHDGWLDPDEVPVP